MRLFHRTPVPSAPVEEGRQFFEEVRPLLAGIEDAASLAAGAASLVRGRLRINSDTGFGQFVLAPNLHRLLSIYPELEVELAIRERPGDLVADGFDLAIRFGEPQASSMICRKILETRVLTCAAPSYLERFGAPAHPRDLADHECIQYREPLTHRRAPVPEGPQGEFEASARGRSSRRDRRRGAARCPPRGPRRRSGRWSSDARPHLDVETRPASRITRGALSTLPLLKRHGDCRPRRCARFSTSPSRWRIGDEAGPDWRPRRRLEPPRHLERSFRRRLVALPAVAGSATGVSGHRRASLRTAWPRWPWPIREAAEEVHQHRPAPADQNLQEGLRRGLRHVG